MESFGFCPYWHVVVRYNNAEPFQSRAKEARERAVLLCNPGACATHLRCYMQTLNRPPSNFSCPKLTPLVNNKSIFLWLYSG